MPEPVTLPHPRRLYSALRSCPSGQERASKEFLEYMCSGTGASGGFLFFAQRDQLLLVASSSERAMPAGLAEEAKREWLAQASEQSGHNTTIELRSKLEVLAPKDEDAIWVSPSGEAFERRPLSVHRGARFEPVGIAMLASETGQALFPLHHVHVEAICNALFDAGDIPEREAS